MGSSNLRSPFNQALKSFVLIALMVSGLSSCLQAQQAPKYTQPSWWFGLAGGANLNFFQGSTQQLNGDITSPTAFHQGNGSGLFLAPLIEYYQPNSRLGFMLQTGYDSRKGSFNTVFSPCNCPMGLTSKLSYLTVEPNLRFAPFKSNFYLYAGPRLAFNLGNSFVYKQGNNPDFPEQEAIPDIKGEFSEVNPILLSAQIGAGLDIPLNSQNNQTQWMLSPFISYQPYFGQDPRSIETWTLQTVRAGVAIKFGRGHNNPDYVTKASVKPLVFIPPVKEEAIEPIIIFSVNAPPNIPLERKVREVFPLRNYVFFDMGSTEIPARYVMLRKNQVKDFKTDQVQLFTPENLSGRSQRQMVVYYNILNIVGDRMGRHPTTSITLVGSSEKGKGDAITMAASIQRYLVEIFGIAASRITIEGREKPKLPALEAGSTQDLSQLRAGDRRVTIESSSPVLLMEFQSGPNAPLKPIEVVAVEKAPLDSYVTFRVQGADEALSSWFLEVKDQEGGIKRFGPFGGEYVRIPGKEVMGEQPNGTFFVTMIGQTKSGKTVKKYSNVNMVLWTPSEEKEVMRFSVIYEFDESKAIPMYKTYLTQVVIPKIPQGGKVIIHGHTDNIGDPSYNQTLSQLRAMDVKNTLMAGLENAGRKDVKFEVLGFGEDAKMSPFENKYPEEQFYNRTVVIDIIPAE